MSPSTYQFELPFHNLPQYDNPQQDIPLEIQNKIISLCDAVWGQHHFWPTLNLLLTEAHKRKSPKIISRDESYDPQNAFSEKQFYLICYGDHLKSKDPATPPLQVLRQFLEIRYHHLAQNLTVHLLPIYSSPGRDGGFDVTDPMVVNDKMGTWEDVSEIGAHFSFALDFVINHLSKESPYFQKFLSGDPQFSDFFIAFDEDNPKDMAKLEEIRQKYQHLIYRPRAHDPFIRVQKENGQFSWVYMTFSDHQPDVNYASPFVFLKMVEILFFYILQGAGTLRLDAIPYIWKEWGTSCAHHPKAHKIVELMSLLSSQLSPSVRLLAESMEPPADSTRYLSRSGVQKAQMCYNFLPCGLIPHTLITQDATKFHRALPQFHTPSTDTAQAVVCGMTHDGTSLNPCRAPQSVPGKPALTETEINSIADYYASGGTQELADRLKLPADNPRFLPRTYLEDFETRHHQPPRFVNLKSISSKGKKKNIVYETISTYASVWQGNAKKIVAAFALGLPLKGIPFLYLTGPLAAFNDFLLYLDSGNPRELNRGRLFLEDLYEQFNNPDSLLNQVFPQVLRLLKVRTSHPAMSPLSSQTKIITKNKHVFSLKRVSADQAETIYALHNISDQDQEVTLKLPSKVSSLTDLISNSIHILEDHRLHFTLSPYQILWLK